MNKDMLRQRFFLWVIVKMGTQECTPRQYFNFWRMMGAGSFCLGVIGLIGVLGKAEGFGWLIAISLVVLVTSVVLGRMAGADLKRHYEINGRVTDCKRLWIKGIDTHGSRRDEYRITIADDDGNERIYRAPLKDRNNLSEGDLVRARVGMHLRWIFDIEVTKPAHGRSGEPSEVEESSSSVQQSYDGMPPEPDEVQAQIQRDREFAERVAADPQAVLEEVKRKRAELEARRRRL